MTRLILLPGLAGDATMWQGQLEALTDWQPVVSDVHAREGNNSIEAMATALLAAHDGELVLSGASMGGMLAMEVARQAPARIAGLALLGTNARPETEDMRELREAAIRLFEQDRVREVIEPNVHFAFHADSVKDRALVQRYVDFVLAAGARQLIRQNRAVISRPDARLHLQLVRCPTLVMCGQDDQLTPPECSAEIAKLVSHAKLVTLPRCGHMLTMEKPAEVSATLREWLQAL
jgi:pimeloyl-ACP methyl ester carboxylesterase